MKRVLLLLAFSLLYQAIQAQLKFGIRAGYSLTAVVADSDDTTGLSPFGGVVFLYTKGRVALQSGITAGKHTFMGYYSGRSPYPGSPESPKKQRFSYWDITLPLVLTYKHSTRLGEWQGGGGYAFSFVPELDPAHAGSLFFTSCFKFHHSNLFLQLDYQPAFFYEGKYQPYSPQISRMRSQLRLGAGLWFGRKDQ